MSQNREPKITEEEIRSWKHVDMKKSIETEDFIREFMDMDRIHSYCRQCNNYGRFWSCPSLDFSPKEYLRSRNYLNLVARKTYIPDHLRDIDMKESLTEILDGIYSVIKQDLTLELLSRKKSYELVLGGGHCNFCKVCRREAGEPCDRPELMTYSIESLGGDVMALMENLLKERVLWAQDGKLPEYLMTVGGILSDEKKTPVD